RALRRLHCEIVGEVIANIERRSGRVSHDPATDLLTINGEFTSSIVVARCSTIRSGRLRWKLRLDSGLRPDITLALRMAPENREPLDYYLLPRIDVAAARLRLAERNGLALDTYRCASLDRFFEISARTPLRIGA